ncbi:MAG: GNAT family N-acetyltransferase [Marinibacterium sp.]|nr:GNAT family N-acetyltransferase [Marinibacterium sp.]
MGGETEHLYAFHPSSHRKGYATEGVRAALEFGFAALKISRIIALAAPENAVSLKVMENVGMTRLPGLTKAFGLQVVKTEIMAAA